MAAPFLHGITARKLLYCGVSYYLWQESPLAHSRGMVLKSKEAGEGTAGLHLQKTVRNYSSNDSGATMGVVY